MTNGLIYCSRCGAQNSSLTKFCANCGTPFTPEPAATPTEVTPRPQGPAQVPDPGIGTRMVQPPVSGQSVIAPRYGGFWIRFVALVIDAIAVGIVTGPVSVMIGFASGLAGGAVSMPNEGVQLVSVVISGAFSMLLNWIYEAALESSKYQATLGKMALSLKVTNLEGQRISFGRATGRHFAKWISWLTLTIGFIIAGFSARKQALHDMIAGTLVVRAM